MIYILLLFVGIGLGVWYSQDINKALAEDESKAKDELLVAARAILGFKASLTAQERQLAEKLDKFFDR